MSLWPNSGNHAGIVVPPRRTLFGCATPSAILDGIAGLTKTELQALLLECNAKDKNRSPLFYAATADVAQCLIDLMVSVGIDPNSDITDDDGNSPLWTVPMGGGAIHVLLAHMDPNHRNKHGHTVLHDAPDEDRVRAAAEAGADPSLVDQNGDNALEYRSAASVAGVGSGGGIAGSRAVPEDRPSVARAPAEPGGILEFLAKIIRALVAGQAEETSKVQSP